MRIEKMAVAGSLESNDVLVTVKPNEQLGREIIIESIVEKQYGETIRKVTEEVLNDFKIDHIYILIQDRGALDCTLRARLKTVILRAQGGNKDDQNP